MHDSMGFRVLRSVVLTAMGLFVLVPIVMAVLTAAQPLGAGTTAFSWLPKHLTLSAFVNVWHDMGLVRPYLNSVIVASVTVVISLPIAVATAIAFSRYRFPGRRSFMGVILSTQAFPGILTLLPIYLIFVRVQVLLHIHLTDSLTGLVVAYVSFSLPFAAWMLTAFFAAFPRDLEQAAMVDGCTEIGAVVRVVLPVSTGAIVAVGVFIGVLAWGEVMFASILTQGPTETLPVALATIVGEPGQAVYWNQLMAGSIYASIPVLVAFFLVQKQFVAGLASGGVKG